MDSTLNLRNVMARVHAMETSPLAHAQRTQQEMGQHGVIFGLRLDAVEHFIHCSQHRAEPDNQFVAGERHAGCIRW